jgi:hypothetical protein
MTDCGTLLQLFIRVLKQIKWIGRGFQSSTQILVGYFVKPERFFSRSYYLTCFASQRQCSYYPACFASQRRMLLLSHMLRVTQTKCSYYLTCFASHGHIFLLSHMFRVTERCSYYLTRFASQGHMFLLSNMFRIKGASFLFYFTYFASQRQCSHCLTFIGLGRPSSGDTREIYRC